jgi:hypothetical protein
MSKSTHQVRQLVAKRFDDKADVALYLSALIGHPDGTVWVADRKGYIWARLGGENGKIIQVWLGGKLLPAYNMPVLVWRPPYNPSAYDVVGLQTSALLTTGSGDEEDIDYDPNTIGPHTKQHRLYGGDVDWIDGQRLLPLLAWPTSPASMYVYINPGWYPYQNGGKYWAGGNSASMASHLPASGYRWTLIYIDAATNAPAYVDSPTYTNFDVVQTQTLLALLPDDSIPICAMLLRPAVTSIVNTQTHKMVYDMRFLITPILGVNSVLGAFGTQAANTFLAGPESGANASLTARHIVDRDVPATIARLTDLPSIITNFFLNITQISTPGATWYNADLTEPDTGDVDLWTADTDPIYFIATAVTPQVIKAGTWRFFSLFTDIGTAGNGVQMDITLMIRHADTSLTTLSGPKTIYSQLAGIGVWGRRLIASDAIVSDVSLAAGDHVVVKLSSPQGYPHVAFSGAKCFVGSQTEGVPTFYVPGGALLDEITNADLPDPIALHAPSTLAIASGAVTVTKSNHIIESESGTTDDLTTISGAVADQVLVLRAKTGHTITVKHGAGNIYLNGAADFVLTGNKALLIFPNGSNWSDVGAGGSGNILNSSAWIAKGDLAVGTGAGAAAILPIGTSGQIPVVDSSETTGIKWTDPAAASAPMISVPGALVSGATEAGAFVIRCKTPGSAGTTTIDCHKNGTTIFTTQANRPALAYDDVDGIAISAQPDVTAIADGDLFTFFIDDVAVGAMDLIIVPAIDWVGAVVTIQYPKSPTMWWDQSIVTAGNALIFDPNVTENVMYKANAYPSSPGASDITENGFTCASGTYTMRILCITSQNSGKAKVFIDGVEVGNFDLYSDPRVINVIKSIASITLSAGYHKTEVRSDGKNGSALGYFLPITKIWLEPAAY